ncbi:MAG: SCO family protein [Candidatus Lambdaproteobacteria bacterium]|nr:SCO family protein [Candidatus Lambdaproteobacteria bacterium]
MRPRRSSHPPCPAPPGDTPCAAGRASRPGRLRRRGPAALAAVAALLLPWAAAGQEVELPEPGYYGEKGGDFTLTGHTGERLALGALRGNVVLLTFGYTSCPDLCPTLLATLTGVWRELGAQDSALRVAFVTLDPERDTASRLAEYLAYFDPAFLGFTGTLAEVQAVARQYRVKFAVRQASPGGPRQVDHSTFIYLIDRRSRLRYLYPHTAPPRQIAAGVRQLLAAKE